MKKIVPTALLFGVVYFILHSPSYAEDSFHARRDFGYGDAVLAIKAIDVRNNATALKVSYFMRPMEQDPPATEVYGLLKDAIKVETVGSKKWFYLENVSAFAALHTPSIDPSEGFESYDLIFDNAKLAAKSDAGYVLSQSINEFVDSVPTKLHNLGLDSDERTRATLQKAWTAYCIASAPHTDAKTKYAVAEPLFNGAIESSEDEDAFLAQAQKSLQDPGVPRSYGVLRTVALAVAPTQPAQAISLLREAKPKLPLEGDPAKKKVNVNEAALLYDNLVGLLLDQNKVADAIVEQKERVKLIGTGQGKLLVLLLQSGDTVGADTILKSLSLPSTDQREIIRAADGLAALSANAKHPISGAKEKAVSLLETYVASPGTKIADYELDARLRLGRYYIHKQELDKAGEVLKFVTPPAPRSSEVRMDIQQIGLEVQRLNELIAAKAAADAQAKGANDPVAGPPAVLEVGQKAPEFVATDSNGTAQSLTQYLGKKNVLLTFFPKCFTGACTNHLTSLRDAYPQLQANDTEVLAVSVDAADGDQGQKAFAAKWNLPFPLIPDTSRSLSILYGSATKVTDLAARQSILIDKTGTIRWIEKHVNVTTHGADVLAKMKELGLAK